MQHLESSGTPVLYIGRTVLKVKKPRWYLYFGAWCIKNMLFEPKKIKLRNTRHLGKNKTEIMQHVLKMQ